MYIVIGVIFVVCWSILGWEAYHTPVSDDNGVIIKKNKDKHNG